MGFRSVAIAMEHSSHASNPARVHLHAYAGVDIRGGVDFMGMIRPSPLKQTDLIWEGGAVPFVKMTLVRRARPAAIFHAVATGVYYVVGGKSGNMFKESSLVPIQDYDSPTETTPMAICVMGVLIVFQVVCCTSFMQTTQSSTSPDYFDEFVCCRTSKVALNNADHEVVSWFVCLCSGFPGVRVPHLDTVASWQDGR